MFREPLPTLDDFQSLPGFRWTGPETKVDPDTQLALDFLVWCRGKPGDEEYYLLDSRGCALAQFGAETGRPDLIGSFDAPERLCGGELFLPLYGEGSCDDWTFGQLADRLESSLSRRGRG